MHGVSQILNSPFKNFYCSTSLLSSFQYSSMDVVGVVSGEVAKSTAGHLEREFGYLLLFKRNVARLRDMDGKLTAAANDVQTLVTAAENNVEVIRQTVQEWLRRARSVQEEANQLIAEARHINSWFKGWCCSRFSLGRQAEKKNVLIQGLLDERAAFGDSVSNPKAFQSLGIASPQGFNVFASRDSLTKQVIQSLCNEKISLVGVHGMPGVGKTMLIQATAKQVKEEKLFEKVVFVIVSQNPVLAKIQGDIAKGLDMNLPEGDTPYQVAARLSERLNKGKAILIVLDDVWERLELGKVGIPSKNKDNGCRVIFTTRERSVCDQMEADAFFEVPLLTEEESQVLFREKAGDVVDFAIPTNSSIRIVRECKGLPLAIVTLGLALRNIEDVLVWEDAFTQLKKSIFEGLSPVKSSIKLSYDSLQNETAKLCFLFCSLFPEDYEIDRNILLKYLVGENLLKNVDNMEEARGRLQSLISKLVSSNLLLKAGDYIMMHDVVRDVAISIASEDDKLRFIVKAGVGLTNWPNMNLSKCKRLSVMHNMLRCDLPCKIQAPQLLTLSLGNNSRLKQIPDDFFNEMRNLLTLDLSDTGIVSLPSSLSCLISLRTLLIERCIFEDISPIKELEKLELLSLVGSEVESWPTGVGKFGNMKLLDLTRSTWGERIPAEVLSSMSQLENLSLLSVNGCLVDEYLLEVSSLTRLTLLEFRLSNRHLSTDIPNFENLIRFSVVCISENDSYEETTFNLTRLRFQRNVYLVIPEETLRLANWVLELVKRAEYLHLKDCQGMESVGELDGTGMNDLKVLFVERLQNMKYLVNSTAGKAPKYTFKSLEELFINSMDSFEAFCRGGFTDGFLCKLRALDVTSCSGVINLITADLLPMLHNLEEVDLYDCARLERIVQLEEGEATSTKSTTTNISYFPTYPIFPNLKTLNVAECRNLEYVFQLRVAQGLMQLRELRVDDCDRMKLIIESDTDDDTINAEKDKLVLPKLEILRVANLPNLYALNTSGLILHCPSLEEFYVIYCSKLKMLSFRAESVPKLRMLNAQEAWFNELNWDNEEANARLHEVFTAQRGT